jgi:hypothetical protein
LPGRGRVCVRIGVVAWRGRESAFHFGPQLGFLFPDLQVGPVWRKLGRIHWLPDVVPGYGGTMLSSKYLGRGLSTMGWKWGKTRYEPACYLIPLGYASAIYALVWLTGFGGFYNARFCDSFSSDFRLSPMKPWGEHCLELRFYCDDHSRPGLRSCTWAGNRLAGIFCTGACQTIQIRCDCHHVQTHLGRVAPSDFSIGGWLQWRHAGLVLPATVYVIAAGQSLRRDRDEAQVG